MTAPQSLQRELERLRRIEAAARTIVEQPTPEALQALADALGLTPPSARELLATERELLSYLVSQGPSPMADVTHGLKRSRGTLHHALFRLERRGLVGSRRAGRVRLCWAIQDPAALSAQAAD